MLSSGWGKVRHPITESRLPESESDELINSFSGISSISSKRNTRQKSSISESSSSKFSFSKVELFDLFQMLEYSIAITFSEAIIKILTILMFFK